MSAIIESQKMFKRMLNRWAARQPRQAYFNSFTGRQDINDGIIIGSQTPVDCSYCLEKTEVDYEPPAP